jgi:hypothetical protein
MMPEQNEQLLRIYQIERGTLEDLKAALSDERLIWVFAGRMEDAGLGWLRDLLNKQPLGAPPSDDRPGVPLKNWHQGRAFGPELEVDWWREEETCRLRVLLEKDKPPEGVDWGEPIDHSLKPQGGKRSLLLHGVLDASSTPPHFTWSEARIPRHLAHPWDLEDKTAPPERVILLGQDYARNGAVVLTRWLKVTSASERKGDAL